MSKTATLSDFESRLLSRLQADFPLVERPFAALAEELGATEAEAIAAVRTMFELGLIREISPVFEARKLGYVSTLVATTVPPERVDEVAALLDGYPEVTHNYLRAHECNVWFTVIAHGEARKRAVLDEIARRTGCELHDLPATRVFKIRAVFELGGAEKGQPSQDGPRGGAIHRANGGGSATHLPPPEGPCAMNRAAPRAEDGASQPPSALPWPVIEALQSGLAACESPFAPLAEQAGMSLDGFLQHTRNLVAAGVIRRFGARVRHHRAGLEGNIMVAWRVPDDGIDAAAAVFTASPAVTHCYTRPPFEGFPYNLYTMVHAPDESAARRIVAGLSSASGITDCAMLRSVRELKKTTPLYHRP